MKVVSAPAGYFVCASGIATLAASAALKPDSEVGCELSREVKKPIDRGFVIVAVCALRRGLREPTVQSMSFGTSPAETQ
jgi:hypothetical protein